MKTLAILVALLALAGAAAAQTEEPDPFAEDADIFGDDPFAALDENITETQQLQDTAEGAKSAAAAATGASETAPAPAPTPAPSAPPAAAPQEPAEEKGAPGFEAVAVMGALAVALLVMRRR